LPRSKTLEKILNMADTGTIYLLTMEYPPMRGGAGVYCEELYLAAEKEGISIQVIGPKTAKKTKQANYLVMPIKGSQDLTCSWKACSYLKNLNLENHTLHLAEPGALRAWIRFGWRVPTPMRLLITLHGSEIPKFSNNFLERRKFIQILKQADKIHLLSKHNQMALLAVCPELEEKIIIQSGAPASDVLPTKKVAKVYKQISNGLILLCVGRIHPRKGQLELLQAIERLPASIKDKVTCRFAGPPTNQAYFKKVTSLSKKSGCKIEFLGELSNTQLISEYEKADLFALTSIPLAKSVEGFGFVYLEASAHGLPIVANRTGGVEDAVVNGQTGLLADPQNQSEVTEHLVTLMEDKDLREATGNAGVQWATEHSWEKVAQALY
jgi:phosphatidylinositol alpha-1,6-mannosyltransferase